MSSLTLNPEELWNLVQPAGRRSGSDVVLFHLYDISKQKPCQWFIKRLADFAGSLFGILLLIPFFLLVALAIWVDAPGPVLYKQVRVGRCGKMFEMYKFRSMRQGADEELEDLLPFNQTNNGMFKLYNDPRVTRVGRFIRKYSIDELPQLINVLRGEMSLVGPRPPIMREVAQYKSWHCLRFATLPGLTGLWQVSGRSCIEDFDDVVKMDYQYIREWSLLQDFILIIRTLPVVLLGKNTA